MKAAFEEAGGGAAILAEQATRVGFLCYPGTAAEDLHRSVAALDPPLTAETEAIDSPGSGNGLEGLRALGDPKRLAPAAQALAGRHVRAIVWACTSGSFVLGSRGAQCQTRELSERIGLPVTSTALAFAAAVRALGVRRVAVASTYPNTVTALFESFLSDQGIDALQLMCLGPASETESRLVRTRLGDFAAADHPRAEALLIPDNALGTAGHEVTLETVLGKPVLTANQVAAWAAAVVAGLKPAGPSRLFAAETTGAQRALLA